MYKNGCIHTKCSFFHPEPILERSKERKPFRLFPRSCVAVGMTWQMTFCRTAKKVASSTKASSLWHHKRMRRRNLIIFCNNPLEEQSFCFFYVYLCKSSEHQKRWVWKVGRRPEDKMMMHQWQINLVKFCHLDELDEKSFNSLLSFPFLCYPKRQMTLTVDDDGRILRKYKKEIISRRYPPM